MSSSDALIPSGKSENEEEVIFVSEQPLRPVLECINLSSDEDNEGNTARHSRRPKDHIDWQKARVSSTLDRLARQVEVEKQLKEEKCKAFQEMVHSQYAHAMQELEFFRGQAATEEARRCVDGWLRVPGPKPGVVSFGRRPVKWRTNASVTPDPIDCPIMNCNRKFDNRHLLLGHLKRFDHSPCDPTITLQGSPSTSYICIACCQRFVNLQKYEEHLALKVDSGNPEGHQRGLEPQICQCFACPSCYLLFNLRDECLRHMTKAKHILQRYRLSGEQGTPSPLPFPSYAKKLLISLCKEVPFQVKCTTCQQMLRTHIELTAHFRTRCRRAGPVAVSAKDIGQVAGIFRVRGRCLECNRLFVDDGQISRHTQQDGHSVYCIDTMDKAIVEFCRFNEKSKIPSDLRMTLEKSKGRKKSPFKRALDDSGPGTGELSAPSPSKRSRRDCNRVRVKQENVEGGGGGGSGNDSLWFCECRQWFDSEQAVEKHIMSANGIHHKCLVCGKLVLDAGIIGLHMSRSHGGAHLTHYVFWCELCRAELLQRDDLMAHITELHDGHTYYYEEEVEAAQLPAPHQPSTSKTDWSPAGENDTGGEVADPDPGPDAPQPEDAGAGSGGSWQCRLCEEMFESEESVAQHCGCLASHQFHKYSCGLCKKRFHRVETLYRHSRDQHDCQISVKYFCGLCDDMDFTSEGEFLDHYKHFHSTDYVFVEHGDDAATDKVAEMEAADGLSRYSCGCRLHFSSRGQRVEDQRRCRGNLLSQGKLWFRCPSCQVTSQVQEDIRAHLIEVHGGTGAGAVVRCICGKSFNHSESAQMHYHSKHSTLQQPQPPSSSLASDEAGIPPAGAECHDGKQTPQDDDAVASTSQSTSTASKAEVEKEDTIQEEDIELPDLDLLRTMTHLVFIDLDNWAGFFNHLPGQLNQGTFFWGFQGGKTNWKAPENCPVYNYLVNTGCFFLHPRCSARKDAADFAICMHAGRMDEQLPKHIPFTVLSGDKGFEELKNQLKKTMRPGHVLNPHQMEGELMCALLNSISDIGKDSDDDDADLQKTLALSLQQTTMKQDVIDEVSDEDEALQKPLAPSLQETNMKQDVTEEVSDEDEALQKTLALSLQETKMKQDDTEEVSDEDEDLQRTLALSLQETKMEQDVTEEGSDEDEALQKTLALSLQETKTKQDDTEEDAKMEEAILQTMEAR
ncbi:E3 SUMO-protein ligase ZNF451 isoform X2 [Leucoraja erinacea]|uniref:E3 SUMO-protein ligase ZNF451 isoform X2 n=1 Tax=Leucoraja erinaceus TaxID=7782 RepID=UPI00245407AA|nr:E3 SUMO-protein ligase ZNF451 isoform X2 [Leucoraja erinacea]